MDKQLDPPLIDTPAPQYLYSSYTILTTMESIGQGKKQKKVSNMKLPEGLTLRGTPYKGYKIVSHNPPFRGCYKRECHIFKDGKLVAEVTCIAHAKEWINEHNKGGLRA